MKKISQKEFFRTLINGRSAKLGAPIYPGSVNMTDELAEEILNQAEDKEFRAVTHVQSNALMFENESWFFFSKPKNCDRREAYQHELNGTTVITLIDHRPAYKNGFGTPISEQTMVLAYEIK